MGKKLSFEQILERSKKRAIKKFVRFPKSPGLHKVLYKFPGKQNHYSTLELNVLNNDVCNYEKWWLIGGFYPFYLEDASQLPDFINQNELMFCRPPIPPAIYRSLIDVGGDINYVSLKSGITPLESYIIGDRWLAFNAIINILIDMGAKLELVSEETIDNLHEYIGDDDIRANLQMKYQLARG